MVKVDIDQNRATAMKYHVRSIPTLLMFKDGQVQATQIGAVGKAQLAQMIDKALLSGAAPPRTGALRRRAVRATAARPRAGSAVRNMNEPARRACRRPVAVLVSPAPGACSDAAPLLKPRP